MNVQDGVSFFLFNIKTTGILVKKQLNMLTITVSICSFHKTNHPVIQCIQCYIPHGMLHYGVIISLKVRSVNLNGKFC